MTNHEASEPHPEWEGAVVGLLGSVELGLVSQEQVIPLMSQICAELVRLGALTNFGELQQYLRQRAAIVQLVAKPFDQNEMQRPDIRCADILTGEPRGHWLMISVGPREAELQLERLSRTDEMNEVALATDTGMLVIDQPERHVGPTG